MSGMKIRVEHHFREAIVDVDGLHFIRCSFRDCELRWHGRDEFEFDRCDFLGVVTVKCEESSVPDLGLILRATLEK